MLKSYVCFDLETTGLDPLYNEIIEIGALKVRDGKVAERFMEFIHPQEEISPMITNLTGITNEMVANARPADTVISDFLEFCEDDVLIGHNVGFDYSFMKSGASNLGLTFEKFGIDTFKIAQRTLKSLPSKSLSSLCEYYQIENKAAHRAYYDALATAKLYQTLAHYFENEDPSLFKPQKLTYKIKKVQPATAKQVALLQRLCSQKKKVPEWNPDTITRSEASRLIDSLLKSKVI
ncbi:3'-5' exonuclease [Coprococcus comes]|uniref:3'-5' exonuclease n=1 Tax=Coprococcus comes TaxID=410072 RepID=UPI00157043D9|nr:3'-5' exonuclease [Coprococcus comes]NSF18073.1 3'-5' exonuclease [Coprococcus comes]